MNPMSASSGFRALRMAALAAVLSSAFALGCYSFVPSQASYLAPGQPVALEINDLGRVNLTPQIGADVARLSGMLVQQTNIDYSIRVEEITYLNGRNSQWSGEPVTVRQDFVRTVFQRKFSSGRTAAAVLASAGVVTGLIVSRNINGSGDTAGGDTKPPPSGTGSRGH